MSTLDTNDQYVYFIRVYGIDTGKISSKFISAGYHDNKNLSIEIAKSLCRGANNQAFYEELGSPFAKCKVEQALVLDWPSDYTIIRTVWESDILDLRCISKDVDLEFECEGEVN